ncbi:LysR family transcriptional regulator [Rhizobium laguerreae]|uniref:LysR substrate-binding domain-containing protein n=1 Tax=Rhizobium laguerreae TaxID=1076926 RepID=UPI001040B5AE|nr:LysR substrate-binding domain-containing protein [Rhizobium laguerreae]MBY3424347.1 LysR family transcriptional regulator [Rhizobium laguerreae]MBY3530737.1 LysR family transcriptional regulator [Rhizobium laguerreae]MBY3544256.1 LysR family transcriptional regulator [Rhizobium laguerreae]MBY3551015.1 LysR family transcriptional regulator [Rhizobium laguerreae]TBY01689.1 LysR family transcriptional regulator [Rhizobium laguerreae]
MKRGRLPLTALRSFEVAGRLESFTLAAQELFVSQAAVSRQIRELETLLGEALFERRHRGVHLTASGNRLLAILTLSFDRIDECLEEIRSRPATAAVTISVEPSFAACWLVPRLPEFRERHPDIDVTIDADSRLIEFRGGQAEIAIRHSASVTAWPRTESAHLADVRMVPVAAPALLKAGPAIDRPEDMLRHTLLYEESRDVWFRWFEAAGMTMPETARGPVYADGGLVMQAVLRGQGIALMDDIFAEEEIRAGRLLRLSDLAVAHGAYWLVARSFDRLAPPASLFVRWISSRIETF